MAIWEKYLTTSSFFCSPSCFVLSIVRCRDVTARCQTAPLFTSARRRKASQPSDASGSRASVPVAQVRMRASNPFGHFALSIVSPFNGGQATVLMPLLQRIDSSFWAGRSVRSFRDQVTVFFSQTKTIPLAFLSRFCSEFGPLAALAAAPI